MRTALIFTMASFVSLAQAAAAGEEHKPGGPGASDPAARWQRFLDRFDADHDGKVSKDEFTSKVGRLFERLDKDADGVVTKAEIDAIERPRMKERAQAWFDRADANHDAKVTRDEAKEGRAKIFERIDANHDGFLTKEEVGAHKGGAGGEGGEEAGGMGE